MKELSRRKFILVSTLAAGFALAVRPISAQVITTDTEGLTWYGRLVGESSSLTPKHPIDIAPVLKAPVLGLYGGSDELIPNNTVERMQQALKRGRSGSEIILYPDTPHGFFADYRPTYRQQQAEDAWKRLQAWFKQHGVG